MYKSILSAALVAGTVAATSLAATGSAEAGYGRNGAFAAGAALGLFGGALIATQPSYGYGYGYGYRPVYYEPACFWTTQEVYDGYGYAHFRKVRVCR